MPIKCEACKRELEVGDRYIVDTPSGFIGGSGELDDLISEVLGSTDGKLYYCENCTVSGGDHLFETYYGDDEG
jgi:hypothetical protein